jgi:hypothetical protein
MIALSGVALRNARLNAEVRRRVGGRALVVSEYARRLVDAVSRLLHLAELKGTPTRPLSSAELEEIFQLDGRIEALRIRLGIESIPAKLPDSCDLGSYGARTETIGFTRLGLCRWEGTYYSPTDLFRTDESERFSIAIGNLCGEPHACASPDDDWRNRMQSLKVTAQELAVVPDLDQEEEEIVKLIMQFGRRLTTTQILDEFSRMGVIKAESTVKGKLAQLTRRKVLVNRSDTKPKGYGLPEWS